MFFRTNKSGHRTSLQQLLAQRRFEFPVEHSVFVTVLHRLLNPDSDRTADLSKHDCLLDGAADQGLHYLDRRHWHGQYCFGGRRRIVNMEQLVSLARTRVFRELGPAECRLFLEEREP